MGTANALKEGKFGINETRPGEKCDVCVNVNQRQFFETMTCGLVPTFVLFLVDPSHLLVVVVVVILLLLLLHLFFLFLVLVFSPPIFSFVRFSSGDGVADGSRGGHRRTETTMVIVGMEHSPALSRAGNQRTPLF